MNAWRAHMATGESRSNPKIRAMDRLIVALDVGSLGRAESVVQELDGVVSFFKIGLQLIAENGVSEFAKSLVSRGKQVFWDIKGNDIPETLRGASASASNQKFSFFTLHGNGDVTDEAITAAVEGKAGTDLKVLLVTVLTSMNDADAKLSYRTTVEEQIDYRVRRAIRLGCDGVIASGQEGKLIREIAREMNVPDLLLVTPGIRPTGVSAGDQKRVCTPGEAIANGADYLVVGRPILQSGDRAAMAESIIAEMKSAFDNRT